MWTSLARLSVLLRLLLWTVRSYLTSVFVELIKVEHCTHIIRNIHSYLLYIIKPGIFCEKRICVFFIFFAFLKQFAVCFLYMQAGLLNFFSDFFLSLFFFVYFCLIEVLTWIYLCQVKRSTSFLIPCRRKMWSRNGKRPQGWPSAFWSDDVVKEADKQWTRLTQEKADALKKWSILSTSWKSVDDDEIKDMIFFLHFFSWISRRTSRLLR